MLIAKPKCFDIWGDFENGHSEISCYFFMINHISDADLNFYRKDSQNLSWL